MIYKIFDNNNKLVFSIESAPKGPNGKYLNHGEFNKNYYKLNYPVKVINDKPIVSEDDKKNILQAFTNKMVDGEGHFIKPIVKLVKDVVGSKEPHKNVVSYTPLTTPSPNNFMEMSSNIKVAFCILKIASYAVKIGMVIFDLISKKSTTVDLSDIKDTCNGNVSLCKER